MEFFLLFTGYREKTDIGMTWYSFYIVEQIIAEQIKG